MNLDDELAELMRRAVDTLDPPTDRLVTGGMARGRTLRRRRYLTLAAEAATCVLVLVAVAATTMQLVTARGNGTSAAASVTPSPTAPAPAAAGGTVAMTGQVMAQTLIDLLPARLGKVDVISATGRSSAGFAAGEVVIDDGHGPAKLAISMSYRLPNHRAIVTARCADGSAPNVTCEILTTGGYLATSKGFAELSPPRLGAMYRRVVHERTDNVRIELTSWNAPTEKARLITRADTPLTVSQMTTIVRSGLWQPRVSAALAARAAALFPTHAPPPPVATYPSHNVPPSAPDGRPTFTYSNEPPYAQSTGSASPSSSTPASRSSFTAAPPSPSTASAPAAGH